MLWLFSLQIYLTTSALGRKGNYRKVIQPKILLWGLYWRVRISEARERWYYFSDRKPEYIWSDNEISSIKAETASAVFTAICLTTQHLSWCSTNTFWSKEERHNIWNWVYARKFGVSGHPRHWSVQRKKHGLTSIQTDGGNLPKTGPTPGARTGSWTHTRLPTWLRWTIIWTEWLAN